MKASQLAACALLLVGLPALPLAVAQEPRADRSVVDRRREFEQFRTRVESYRARLAGQLTDTVASREAAAREAEDGLRKAREAREVAEYAVKEYAEGVYPQELETRKGDVELARADRQRADDVLARLRTSKDQNQPVDFNALEIAALEVEKAKFAVEAAETALEILDRYERDRNLKALQAKVAGARQAEQLAQLDWKHRQDELVHRQQLADDAGTRVAEDLLVHLLDQVVRGEGELARLTHAAVAANEAVIKDPTSAEARAKVEEIQRSLRVEAEATRNALKDAVKLADETTILRKRYADAERWIVAERKTQLGLPPSPTLAP